MRVCVCVCVFKSPGFTRGSLFFFQLGRVVNSPLPSSRSSGSQFFLPGEKFKFSLDAGNLIFFPSSRANENNRFVFSSLHWASLELKEHGAALIKYILLRKRQLGISVLAGWEIQIGFCHSAGQWL